MKKFFLYSTLIFVNFSYASPYSCIKGLNSKYCTYDEIDYYGRFKVVCHNDQEYNKAIQQISNCACDKKRGGQSLTLIIQCSKDD